MRRLILAGLLVLLSAVGASSDTLTTPITTAATQYVVTGVTFNLVAQTVEMRVQFLDASGNVLDSTTTQATFAQFGFTTIRQTTLTEWVVAYLKAQGVIN